MLRATLKDRSFCPLPLRERMIPKAGTASRRLGISTIPDRVVQASLKLVLEPIFEADFLPCSYGFRPDTGSMTRWPRCGSWRPSSMSGSWRATSGPASTRSHTRLFSTGCGFVSGISAYWSWGEAFLKSGILAEDHVLKITAPEPRRVRSCRRCSATSPCRSWTSTSPRSREARPRRPGNESSAAVRPAELPPCAIRRRLDYHGAGTKDDAQALRDEVAQVLARIGLRLSAEKTLITHIDEGLDFSGWRIQRHRKRGANRCYVYTYPSRKALRAAMAKVKSDAARSNSQPLDDLMRGRTGCLVGRSSSAPGCPARPSST